MTEKDQIQPEHEDLQPSGQQANDTTPETPEQVEQEANAAYEAMDQQDVVVKLEQEVVEYRDKYMRLYADFENFRKRSIKEKADFMATASEGVMVAMLPIIDDFERAMNAMRPEDEAQKAYLEGVTLIYTKLLKTLEGKGLSAMEDAKGKPMDLELHEAITQIPAPTPELQGKVVDVIEKGYVLNGKVIRYAKVVTGA